MAQPFDRSLHATRTRRLRTQARRRSLALECLESRQLLTSMPYQLFDTGVDDTGSLLAGGASDAHYTMTVTQQGTAGQAAQVTSANASGWVGNSASSHWIAPTANQSNGSSQSPAGMYVYETTATVATAGKGFIQGYVAADDTVAISINGTPTTFSATSAMGSLNSFKVFGDFVANKPNTIDFVVTNSATGPTGLQVNGLTLNMAPTVGADMPTISVAYGGTLSATGTFADPDAGDSVSIASNRANGAISQSGSQSGTYTLTENNVTKGGTVTITGTDSQGNITTTTFNLVVVPPSLTAGGVTGTNRANSTPTLVDPNIVLTDPNGPNLSSASVSIGSNFKASEDRLLFSDQNGITGSYNTSTGILTLSGSATPADYQTALRTVAYQNINTNPATVSTAPRTINFSIAPGTFNPTNGHFYQFVQNRGITWTNAKAAADASSLYGLQGYLATLTSEAENVFAFSKTQSTGWIGASDANTPGHWKWVDGPETGLEFWQGDGATGSPVNGQYNDWNDGEPNNSQNVEFYAQYLQSGQWNDLANNTIVNGYLIEYGGSQDDPSLQLTSQATMNVVSQTAAPTVTSPSTTAYVNASFVSIGGSAEAGSLVRVYNDINNNGVIDEGESVVGSETLSGGQTAYSIAVQLDPNATTHFLVTATAGSASESNPTAVPAITQDSIAPNQPVVTAPAVPSYTRYSTVVFSGTAEAGSLVQIYNDSNNNGVIDEGDSVARSVQLADAASSFDMMAPLAANSANHFLITATDKAGNVSIVEAMTVVADTIAPTAPILVSPATTTVVNTASAPITGTAEARSLIRVYRDSNGNGLVDEGDVLVGFDQMVGEGTGFTVDAALTANRSNDLLVTATDMAGNESLALAVPTITQDSIEPSVPTLASPLQPVVTQASTIAIVGRAEAGSLVLVYQDADGSGSLTEGDLLVGQVQMASDQTTFTLMVPLAANSANQFLVTATDRASNTSVPIATPTITTDTIAPVLPVAITPRTPQATTARSYTLSGRAEAGSLVQVYSDTNGNGVVDENDTLVGSVQLASDQSVYSMMVPLTSNAANRFLVTATDEAGNVSDPLAVAAITHDTIAPVAPVLTGPTGPVVTSATTAPITGTAEAGSLVRLYRDSNGNGLLDSGDALVGTVRLDADQTTFSFTGSLTSNAANRFLVTATDAAGNVSAPKVVPTITTDTVAPVVPTTGTTAPKTTTKGVATISGTAEAGSLVQVYRDTNGNGVIDDGEVVLGQVRLAADQTSYSIDVPLTPGSNHFLVATTDRAGNRSTPLAFPTVTKSPAIQGTVFLDINNNGVRDGSESPLAGRVVYLDRNNTGTFVVGDPTATTDAQGHFDFADAPLGSGVVRELLARDATLRYVLNSTTTDADGSMLIGATPYSALMPMPVLGGSAVNPTATDPAARFVQSLYQSILGRTGSDAEVATWLSEITDGASRAEVAAGFIRSPEHRLMQVVAYYSEFLHRSLDPGAATWVNQLLAGASEQEVAGGILASAEYLSSHATADDLTASLYRDVLGREGSRDEVAGWDAALASGLSRGELISQFVDSAEAHDQAVAALYTFALGRQREAVSSSYWTDRLAADGTVSEVAIGILASDEFLSKARKVATTTETV